MTFAINVCRPDFADELLKDEHDVVMLFTTEQEAETAAGIEAITITYDEPIDFKVVDVQVERLTLRECKKCLKYNNPIRMQGETFARCEFCGWKVQA